MDAAPAQTHRRQADLGNVGAAEPERLDVEMLAPPERPPASAAKLQQIIRRALLAGNRRERLVVAAIDWRGLPADAAAELAGLPVERVQEIRDSIAAREERALARLAAEQRLRRVDQRLRQRPPASIKCRACGHRNRLQAGDPLLCDRCVRPLRRRPSGGRKPAADKDCLSSQGLHGS